MHFRAGFEQRKGPRLGPFGSTTTCRRRLFLFVIPEGNLLLHLHFSFVIPEGNLLLVLPLSVLAVILSASFEREGPR
jgi:hypothetical protein